MVTTSASAVRDRRISTNVAAPIAFGGNLLLAALDTQLGGTVGRPAETALLAVFAAAVACWSTLPGATAVGGITWLFYLGFVVGEGGELALHGWTPLVSLAGLLGLALVAASLGEAVTRHQDVSSNQPRTKEK